MIKNINMSNLLGRIKNKGGQISLNKGIKYVCT